MVTVHLICTFCVYRSGCPGRPRSTVSIDEILELRSLHYKWTKISSILGISRAMLYRRLEENGIPSQDGSMLDDDELDDVVRAIKIDHPNDGERLVCGHLRARGLKLPRQAVRDSIHRTDHENVARRCNVVRRLVYSAPHPNYVWHIDGHHKLIRWRFVIHGSIDGFSRTITYLACANNNRSETVLQLFTDSINHFGVPNHVRSDHGGENVEVWRYMIAAHNHDYSCVITGSSVHNERVERLWRDVHRCIVSVFSPIFRSLENDGLLDPLNEVDLYFLHLIFLPQINKCISDFKESWNHHPLSTEGNRTPYQLFFEGMLHTNEQQLHNAANVDTSDLEGERVSVPRIKFIPCSLLEQSFQTINPLEQSDDNGRGLFVHVLHIAGQHLNATCSQCIWL